MAIKRINLCFEIDDARQKIIYDYLQSKGREKTKTAVELMGKALSDQVKEERQKGELAENIVALVNKNTQETTSEELKNILSVLLRVERKIENFSNELSESGTKLSSSPASAGEKAEDTDNTTDMNDDVFSAVMSMFG